MRRVDLAVIGAGPAGMAAAAEAARAGLRVLLLDEQPRAGGQIFRNVERAASRHGAILGPDFAGGAALVRALDHPDIAHEAGACVWSVEGGTIGYSVAGAARRVEAAHVLIATGALERPMPVPGWTLPGVMTAGAAQILLKGSGLAPREAVLVGSGPLLYLVAVQLLRAGCPPRALVETSTRADMRAAALHWRAALRGWRYLHKGAAMLIELRNAGVPRWRGARDIALLGRRRVETVHFKHGDTIRELAAETVLLHHGVVPNVQASMALDLPHRWDARQQAFAPEHDRWGRTAEEHVWVAGDGAGIGGARAAELSGRITGLGIAHARGAIARDQRDARARPLIGLRDVELSIRPFLDRAFPPYAGALAPADEVTVCRCEEVSAGAVRHAAALGAAGPNQAKALTRAGMGRCQGRNCGLTVSRLIADAQGKQAAEGGYFRLRPPLKPVTLGELAALHDPADPVEQAGGHG